MHHLLLALPLALTLLTSAPLDDQPALKEKLEKKLAKGFVESGGWRLDYGKARTEAKEKDQLLFVYFTRTFAP